MDHLPHKTFFWGGGGERNCSKKPLYRYSSVLRGTCGVLESVIRFLTRNWKTVAWLFHSPEIPVPYRTFRDVLKVSIRFHNGRRKGENRPREPTMGPLYHFITVCFSRFPSCQLFLFGRRFLLGSSAVTPPSLSPAPLPYSISRPDDSHRAAKDMLSPFCGPGGK